MKIGQVMQVTVTSTGLGEDRTGHAGNCYFYGPE